MRIDSLMQRGFKRSALVLAAVLGSAACHEADGTKEWPGVYPPEEEIDRPKGGAKDAGRTDAGSDAGSAEDASADGNGSLDASASDAALDASTSDAALDATPVADSAAEAGAPTDAAASEAG